MASDPTPAIDPPAEAAVDLGPLPTMAGYALRRAHAVVLQDFGNALAGHDIRPAQFSVLVAIRRNPGLRQTQLSFALGIKTTNFVPLLDELERRALAERRPIAGDRRARGLFLTAHGQNLLAQLETRADEHEARVTARIGAGGKAQLLDLLRRLTDAGFDAKRDGNYSGGS